MSDVKRIDLPPDPYLRLTRESRVREPKRMETIATTSSVEPMPRLYARVFDGGANQSIPNNVITLITWPDEFFDRGGIHSPTVNNSRITIPSTGRVSGLWMFHTVIGWEALAAGYRELFITRNGIGQTYTQNNYPAPAVAQTIDTQENFLYFEDPNPGDYFEVSVRQTSGAPLNVMKGAFTSGATYFEAGHMW